MNNKLRNNLSLFLKLGIGVVALVLVFIIFMMSGAKIEIASDTEPGISDFSKDFPNPKMAKEYFALKKKNKKCIGWLNIPNLCYYPIMYSKNKQYFLDHDSNNKPSIKGAIYLNSYGKPKFGQGIALIQGHNMNDNSMFGALDAYKQKSFFQDNDPIEIFDGKYLRLYKPFTALLLHGDSTLIKLDEMNLKHQTEYLTKLAEKTVVNRKKGEKFDYSKSAVFFATCDYTFGDARLVIGAIQIKEYKYIKKQEK